MYNYKFQSAKSKSFAFYYILFVLLLLSVSTYGQIQFLEIPFNKALTIAGEEKKLVFIDCYTEWCGPCKKLDAEVFQKKETGDFINKNFICIKMNMEKQGSKIKGIYQITAYPTLLFLDEKGELMQKSIGYKSVSELLEVAAIALDPEKNTHALNQKYENGSAEFYVILNQLENTRRNDSNLKEKLLDKYFNSIDHSQWTDSLSWKLIKEYVPLTSKYFKFLITNEDAFKMRYGKIPVDQVILNKFIVYYTPFKAYEQKLQALDFMRSFNHPFCSRAILIVEGDRFKDRIYNDPLNQELWLNFLSTIDLLIKNFGKVELIAFRRMTWLINEKHSSILSKIREVILSTHHELAPLMVQYIDFGRAESILKKNKLFKIELSAVLKIADTIIVNCLVDYQDVNNLAWDMLKNSKRDLLLNHAKKLSFLTLSEKKYYHFGTYGAICAQMLDFEEALKYQQMALELARKEEPKRIDYYKNNINKISRHEPLFGSDQAEERENNLQHAAELQP